MVHQAWSAGTLATHGPIILGLHRISSLDPTLCWTRVEDIYILKHNSIFVLQNIETEIKLEPETYEEDHVKQIQDVTYRLVPLVKVEGKVNISILLYTVKI